MHRSTDPKTFPRVLAALATVVVLVAAVTAAPQHRPANAAPRSSELKLVATGASSLSVTLNSVGSRYVGTAIPIKGYTSGLKHRSKLALQKWSTRVDRWWTVSAQYVGNGAYRFASQRVRTAGRASYRSVLYAGTRPARKSPTIRVPVLARPAVTCASAPSPTTCPKPAPYQEQRTVEAPACSRLVVATHLESRTVDWIWKASTATWVRSPSAWAEVPGSAVERAATAADCVHLVAATPAGAVLPDLRIKDLTKCGAGDAAATGGTCFMIVPSAPFNADFPSLAGRKLLKFGVITLNVGGGPGEVIADRSAADAEDWKAYQTFYGADGTALGSVLDPGVQFYFAGDGHNHWHVRDFDDYELLAADGSTVARAEKHGYCMQDNTTYTPMQGLGGVPAQPVYGEATSCGKGLPQALTIIHGLSRGWGDTYPTTLPDQAIDVTGLPDGVYTVRVHADAAGALVESDEGNNVAEVKVQLSGDTVSVVPDSSVGGLP